MLIYDTLIYVPLHCETTYMMRMKEPAKRKGVQGPNQITPKEDCFVLKRDRKVYTTSRADASYDSCLATSSTARYLLRQGKKRIHPCKK